MPEEHTENCAGVQNNTTVYPTEPCPDCPKTDPEDFNYVPQACIKVKNYNLISCSTNPLPNGCEKIVKIYTKDLLELLFSGNYADANVFAKNLEDGSYSALEVISCEGGQTESGNICFEKYTVNSDISTYKRLKQSCKCCDYTPVGYDAIIDIDCDECYTINFDQLYDGNSNVESVVISGENPVTSGTLTALNAVALQYCPAAGFTGSISFGYSLVDAEGKVTEEKTITFKVRNNCAVDCTENTVTVQLIDTMDDTPITSVTYPINVMSPFSTSSGTGGALGNAANYAGIISKLNADANKPAGITFVANVDETKINVKGTCEFNDIKIGDSISVQIKEILDTNADQNNLIEQLQNQIQYQQTQINYLISHMYDCCAEPPAPPANPFAGTKVELCTEPTQGRITYTLTTVTVPGISAVNVLQKILDIPSATPNFVVSATPTNMIVPSASYGTSAPGMRYQIANIANTDNKFKLYISYVEAAVTKYAYLIFDLPHFGVTDETCVANIMASFQSMIE